MKLDRLALIANQLEGTIAMPKNFSFDMRETYESHGNIRRGCILGLLAANFIDTDSMDRHSNILFLTTWEIINGSLREEGETDDQIRDTMADLLFGDPTNDAKHQAKRIRQFLERQGYTEG